MNSVFPYANLTFKKKKIGGLSWEKIISADNIKLGALVGGFIVLSLVYIITVNLSSTEGYYYDQMVKQQKRADFSYNVSKLKHLSLQSKLWNDADFSTKLRSDSVQTLELR